MAELIVVTGPPGAGKSTVARLLSAQFERSALVEGDAFFAFIDRGYRDPWTAGAREQNAVVVDAAAAAAGRLAAGGYTLVYDGVLGPWFLDEFGAATGLRWLQYAVLMPPEPVCLHRVSSRAGHGFTDLPATRHMYREFAQADIDRRNLITSVDAPTGIATRIRQLVEDGSLHHSIGTAA